MSQFEITIVNYFDRNDLVAEIYYNSFQWAEISKESGGQLTIQFYSHPKKEYWEFPCDEAIEILRQAKTKLLIRRNTGSFLEKMMSTDPQEVNEMAEKILEEIVNHPEKKVIPAELQRFGNVTDIYIPNGRGARYSATGEFIGFLE